MIVRPYTLTRETTLFGCITEPFTVCALEEFLSASANVKLASRLGILFQVHDSFS
jgi:hypothetical protein